MTDQVNRIPGVQFDIETKSHTLPHRPKAVASAYMYLYTYAEAPGEGYRQWQRIKMEKLTLEQLELLQFLQLEVVKHIRTTEGEPYEIHE